MLHLKAPGLFMFLEECKSIRWSSSLRSARLRSASRGVCVSEVCLCLFPFFFFFFDCRWCNWTQPTAPRVNVLKVVNWEQTVLRWLAESCVSVVRNAHLWEAAWPNVSMMMISDNNYTMSRFFYLFIFFFKAGHPSGKALLCPPSLNASLITVCGSLSCLCLKLMSTGHAARLKYI